MKRLRPLAIVLLLVLVVESNVAMLTDPDMPPETGRRLALINALSWAVILLPPIGVGLWLRAMRRQNAQQRRD